MFRVTRFRRVTRLETKTISLRGNDSTLNIYVHVGKVYLLGEGEINML